AGGAAPYGVPPGYGPPGYGPPGYGPPGHGPAGYGPPGYGSLYGAPGYGAPGAGPSGYGSDFGYPVQPRTDGLAAGALLASIVGILTTCLCIGVAGSIAGIIMGAMSRRRIRESNGMLLGN